MSLCSRKISIAEPNDIVQEVCHHADEKQISHWCRHNPTHSTTSSTAPEPRRLYCSACTTEKDLHETSTGEIANSLTHIQFQQQGTASTQVEGLRLGQVNVLVDTTASEHVNNPATPAASLPSSTIPDALFEVRSSPLGGSGVFALQDLGPGQQILAEAALFYADKINLYEEVDKLDPASRKLFDDLHAFKRTGLTDVIAARFWTNCFKTALGSGIFPLSARFNHACRGTNNVDFTLPSCPPRTSSTTPSIISQTGSPVATSAGTIPITDAEIVTTHLVMKVCSSHGVRAGEELTVAYGPPPDVLLLNWGFRCRCGGCEGGGLTDEQVEELLGDDPWAWYRSSGNSSHSIKVGSYSGVGAADGSDDDHEALLWLGDSEGKNNSSVWQVPESCGKRSTQW